MTGRGGSSLLRDQLERLGISLLKCESARLLPLHIDIKIFILLVPDSRSPVKDGASSLSIQIRS